MANESFGLSFDAPPRLERTTLPSIAFFALLILIFVGLQPFTPPASVVAFGGVVETSGGDMLRQIAYLSVFAIILVCAIQRRGLLAAAVTMRNPHRPDGETSGAARALRGASEKTRIWALATLVLMAAFTVFPIIHFTRSWRGRMDSR